MDTAAEQTGNRTIVYYDDEGNPTRTHSGGNIQWRNNNPGNLILTPFTRSMGAIGRDSAGFAIFPDAETGLRAKGALLREGRGYKGKTIAEMMPAYAGLKDDPDKAKRYIKDIGDFSGLDVNRESGTFTDEEWDRLNKAIARREG